MPRQARACSRRRSEASSLRVWLAMSAAGSGPSAARTSQMPSSAQAYRAWVGKNPNSSGRIASRGDGVVVVMARPYAGARSASWTNATWRLRGRHEVDQLLDRADERGVEVGVGPDPAEQRPPELAGRRPDAERGDHALLPRLARRDHGPGVDAGGPGADGLPHVDVRRAPHQHVGVADGGGGPRLLAAVDQVVE